MQGVEQRGGNIKVVCRFRPTNQREKLLGGSTIHEILDQKTIGVKQMKPDKNNAQPLQFSFDRIFDCGASQQQVFSYTASSVIDSVIEGFNGTIFAYGQTASGKTYTMEGNIGHEISQNSGIIPRMIKRVFEVISQSSEHIEFRLKVSLVQLYMEKLRDLLEPSKSDLKIRSDKKRGIYIQDLTQTYISSAEEVFELMAAAHKNRAIAVTNMNQRSSRSHMLFILTISQNNTVDLSAKTGKLHLVDLAGSEKVGKTGAEGKVLDEAKKINASLASLGKVINALTDGKSIHIPYRDSKLTRVLTQSLGGNSKTTLIITCSPHSNNIMETLSTLRFGVSAKKIKNKPKINREFTVPELQNLLQKAEREVSERQSYIQQLKNHILVELKQKSVPAFSNQKTNSGLKNEENDLLAEMERQLEMQRSMHLVQEQQINNLKKRNQLLSSEKENLQKEFEKLKKISQEPIQRESIQSHSKMSSGNEILGLTEEHHHLLEKYEEEKQKRIQTEDKLTKSDARMKKKLIQLQNNICQLTHAYYDLLIVQQRYKVDNIYLRRKLQDTNISILSLKGQIKDLQDQNRELQDQRWNDEEVKIGQKEFSKFSISEEQNAILNDMIEKNYPKNSKVVKILKGGGK